MQFGPDVIGAQRMNPNDDGVPVTLPFFPQWIKNKWTVKNVVHTLFLFQDTVL